MMIVKEEPGHHSCPAVVLVAHAYISELHHSCDSICS